MADQGTNDPLPSTSFMNNVLHDAVHDSPLRCGVIAPSAIVHRAVKDEITRAIRALPRPYVRYDFLWVHGPAGVGKTTIMHSIASELLNRSNTDTQNLNWPYTAYPATFTGASFFFSHKNQVTDRRMFFSTLAYGLARHIPGLAPYVQFIFDTTPGIAGLSLKEQCDALIVRPIHAWAPFTANDYDIFMIVDGLDECDGGEEAHIELINAIHQTFSCLRIDNIRWHWIVSSRSEAWIHSATRKLFPHTAISIPLATQAETKDHIRTSLNAIRTSYLCPPTRPVSRFTLPSSSTIWASKHTIEILWWHSAGYFAYTSSLLAYITEPNASPHERIRKIISHAEHASFQHPTDRTTMFTQLDAAYHGILSQIPAATRDLAKRVLGAVSLMQPSSSDDPNPTAGTVSELLGIRRSELFEALYYLHSVLTAPIETSARSYTNPEITFYHKSFNEFLRNASRSGEWSVDAVGAHADLAKSCLRRLGFGPNGRDRGNNSDSDYEGEGDESAYTYAAKRWFWHCWRTGMDPDSSSADAAFGLLPELYEFDYTFLPGILIDRYFVEWLLRVQELTMSEYLILNPGPEYTPPSTPPPPPSTPFYHPPSSPSSPTNRRTRNTKQHHQQLPRPTYILGLDAPKQVLLVPCFGEKERPRSRNASSADRDAEELSASLRGSMGAIGPREKWWTWIRGFRPVMASALEQDTNVDVDVGTDIDIDADADASASASVGGAPEEHSRWSDYDEFVARSLAWEEENGGLIDLDADENVNASASASAGPSTGVNNREINARSCLFDGPQVGVDTNSTNSPSTGDTSTSFTELLAAALGVPSSVVASVENGKGKGKEREGDQSAKGGYGGISRMMTMKSSAEEERGGEKDVIRPWDLNALLDSLDDSGNDDAAAVAGQAVTSSGSSPISVAHPRLETASDVVPVAVGTTQDSEDHDEDDYFSAGDDSSDSDEMVVVDAHGGADSGDEDEFELVEKDELLH